MILNSGTLKFFMYTEEERLAKEFEKFLYDQKTLYIAQERLRMRGYSVLIGTKAVNGE